MSLEREMCTKLLEDIDSYGEGQYMDVLNIIVMNKVKLMSIRFRNATYKLKNHKTSQTNMIHEGS